MLPYYCKFRTLNVPSDSETCEHLGIERVDEKLRGTLGPIQASFQGVVQYPLSKAWIQTFKGLGRELKTDPFSGGAVGGYNSPITVDPESKTRSCVANTYLPAAAGRKNLTVITGAVVQNVLLETDSGATKAIGVEVAVQGSNHTIKAQKENPRKSLNFPESMVQIC